MDKATAASIRDIARRIGRLAPDWSDPRRFYNRRDDLVDELVMLVDGRSSDRGAPR